MTDKERAKLYPIILTGYNPDWKEWFKTEKTLIEKYIGIENILSIRHIGSTSVEGLIAKPTVDILLEIPEWTDINKLKVAFPTTEYVCLDRQTMPTSDILVFLKGYTDKGFEDKVYHIHVRYKGDWDEVYFRDYINAHPEIAAEYAVLKLSLKDKFEYDRDGYTDAKSEFIAAVTKKARELRQLQVAELASTEIESALKLVWEVFSEFEAPEYQEEGIAEFKRFIEPESFMKEFKNGNIKIYGAKINDEIAGVIATRGISHICLLFVAKKYHRQGIAKQLFYYAENIAVKEAKTEMTVNSSPYAVEVYKKFGFTAMEKEKVLNGIKFTPMKKHLKDSRLLMSDQTECKLEEISEFFNSRAEVYDERHLGLLDGGIESKRIIASFLPNNAQSIIDFGIGTGLELEAIYKRFPNINITGLDVAMDMLEQLKKKYAGKIIELRCASYLDYDFGKGLYDAALSVMTFHHYSHDVKTQLYRRIHKCLKQGGVYIECDYMLSEHEFENAQAEEDFFFAEYERIKKEQSLTDGKEYHYDTPCTVSNQIAMLLQAGFKSVKEVWRTKNNVILLAKK